MGTEVLRPSDYLIHHRIRLAPVVLSGRKTYRNGQQQPGGRTNNNGNNTARGNRRVQVWPKQRRKSLKPPRPKRSTSVGDLKERSVGQVKVTILRSGESIEWKADQAAFGKNIGGDDGAVLLFGTQRLGPDPKTIPKLIRLSSSAAAGNTYNGSEFSMSPSLRAVLFSSFFSSTVKFRGIGIWEKSVVL